MLKTIATKRLFLMSLCGGLLCVGACGGSDGTHQPRPTEQVWRNVQPRLLTAGPAVMSVGQKLTVLGSDFVDPNNGRLILQINGTYYIGRPGAGNIEHQPQQQESYPVAIEAIPQRANSGELRWRLWPNVAFDPRGDRLGYFLGDVKVINAGHDGSRTESSPLAVKIEVGPSLVARQVTPTSANCSSIVPGTLEDVPMAFTVEAIGLPDATVDEPMTFQWTLLSDHWQVSFGYDTLDPESVLPPGAGFSLQQRVISGRVSSIADAGTPHLVLQASSDFFGDVTLKKLRTKPIAAGGNNYEAMVNVMAVAANGESAQLTIPLQVHRVAEVRYDGSWEIAERYYPQKVSDCIPGGDIGRQVNYREDKSEHRVRSLSFNYHSMAALTMGYPPNPFALSVNFNAGFGVDINASVSSQTSQSLDLSAEVLPGHWAVFYRQTTRVHRIGQLTGYNQCGGSDDLGQAILQDWIFTPELAQGSSCPPPSELPRPVRLK